MRPVADPLRNYRIATLILKAAHDLFNEHEVPWFNRAGVTAKGGDWECEDCSGIFVWYDRSERADLFDSSCVGQRRYTFQIETGRCVNENLPSDCGQAWYGPELGDGCPEDITPELSAKCGNDRPPHIEAAFLWRDRTVLESMLAKTVDHYICKCLEIRNGTVTLETVTQETGGACHNVLYQIDVVY